jgi:hypothetical protein
MSDAAEKYVAAFRHPEIKGSARDLLEAIARHIPEGQTTTTPMTLPDWANVLQRDERTVRTCRDRLVRLGELKVHDGGRGNARARWELVHLLTGARPVTPAPLPLLGRPKPRRTKEQRSTSDLFSVLDAPTSDLFSDVPRKRRIFFPTLVLAYEWIANNVGSFFRSWSLRTIKQRSTSDLFSDVGPLVDEELHIRARDVHTLKNVHTHALDANANAPPTQDAPTSRPPPRHPWHAWCGPVCVPKDLHQAWLDKGHEAAWLNDFYARTCATVTAEEARRVVDEFKFWRPALAAELGQASPSRGRPTARDQSAPTPPPQPEANVWTHILGRIESKVSRHEFYTWLRTTALLGVDGDTIEVTADSWAQIEWIEKHYGAIVAAAAAEVRPGASVLFIGVHDGQRRQSG